MKSKGPRYSVVPAAAVLDQRLTHTQLRLLLVLGTYTDHQGWCWPAQGKMAEKLKVSRTWVNRSLKQLVTLGYITSVQRKDPVQGTTTCLYRVVLDTPCEPELTGGVNSEDHTPCELHELTGGVNSGLNRPCEVQELTQTSHKNVPENVPENVPPGPISDPHSGGGNGNTNRSQQQDTLPPGFVDFWAAYPRKKAKGDALKAWKQLSPDKCLQLKILDAIAAQKKGRDWIKDNGEFIPYPATWLRAQQWEDEVTPPEDNEEISDSLKELLGYKNRGTQ